ncbi:hypothetical protein [Luteipulveratus mongoliensis]|uniref:Uncharacterized protein n=1 Tax=Luteipulveratus mongoliensis TaxID=571913 RepID=A0A0K1JNT2_9MICO|nr:hypothetical protein [Luteipulveratus mongoliensis]AKU18243.1 hypothetical protein VV02_24295 [Luteipulveratus mongoliensis]
MRSPHGSSQRHSLRPAVAVRFPVDGGSRSTSRLGAAVLADSFRGINDDDAARVAAGAAKWRQDYVEHFARSTAVGAGSGESALGIARQGLASLQERMTLAMPGGDRALEIEQLPTPLPVDTETVRGQGERVGRLEVPYAGRMLAEGDLRAQLGRWVEQGLMEPAFGTAIEYAIDHPDVLSAPDHTVVVLGAGAAMGPLAQLARWGADVVGLDVPDAAVQARIKELARSGSGVLRLPVVNGRDVAGLGLTEELPEAVAWLTEVLSTSRTPALANHLYADGGSHVELTVAADLLASVVLRTQPRSALAYLATPTDSFLVPIDAVEQARKRFDERAWHGPVRCVVRQVSARRLFQPAYPSTSTDEHGSRWGVINTLVPVQGPNYALAKRAQRWRAMVAHAEGVHVSANVAPASWTHSVTKNKVLAAVFRGAHRFGVEIFEADTASALMAAKLVVDLARPQSAAASAHPEAMFSHDAVHGGLWRQPYTPHSALGVAALAGFITKK